MSRYTSSFTIGNLLLDNNIFYAPLAGCSDYPFRRMAISSLSSVRPGLFFCEMVKMDALIRREPTTHRLLDYDASMHPIGAQLCGSNIDYVADSCHMIEDLGFDWIDLNCGCPVDKITKDGSGSALLRNPEKIGDILHKMVSSTSLPVSLKIRAGWDDESINAREIAVIAEEAGASLITIHGRTRQQAYKGKAAFSPIREAKQAVRSLPVFANGDVFDPISAKNLFDQTGADGILVARGTMGQPWIVEDIAHFYATGKVNSRSILEIKEYFLAHFQEIVQYQPDKKALLDMRRVGSWFLRTIPGSKELRDSVLSEKNPEAVLQMLREFDWQSFEESSPLTVG